MFKKILLPVSGEVDLEKVKMTLNRALQLGGGEIVLLHVTEPISQVLGGQAREEVVKEESARGFVVLSPIIEMLENAGAAFHTRVVAGTPAETIVQIADEEQADLIVMYTDGRDNLGDMMFGSITERVLRDTNVNLLAVRN